MTETTIAFVCVQNAGRSQMAHAFARREAKARGVEEQVVLVTGGTDPADQVHEGVIAAMDAVGIDLRGITPREITFEETRTSEYVITMGCSASNVCPAGWAGENRDWDLEDPAGKPSETVASIRNEIESRVTALFDEILADK